MIMGLLDCIRKPGFIIGFVFLFTHGRRDHFHYVAIQKAHLLISQATLEIEMRDGIQLRIREVALPQILNHIDRSRRCCARRKHDELFIGMHADQILYLLEAIHSAGMDPAAHMIRSAFSMSFSVMLSWGRAA